MTLCASFIPPFAPRPRSIAFAVALLAAGWLAQAQTPAVPASAAARLVRNGDYIAAVVNQELVTAGEVERRIERAQA